MLDTRRAKKDGSYSIKIELYHHSRNALIGIGSKFCCLENDWDKDLGKAKNTFKNSSRFNYQLNDKISRSEEVLIVLDALNILDRISLDFLKEQIKSHLSSSVDKYSYQGSVANDKKNKYGLREYKELVIDLYRQREQWGMAKNYKSSLAPVFDYLDTPELKKQYPLGEDTLLIELDLKFVLKYEGYLTKRGWKEGGIFSAMKILKGLYNHAIKNKDLESIYHPFENYTLREPRGKNQRKKQSRQKLNRHLYFDKFRELNLMKDSDLWHLRNQVLFMWNCMGMNYRDVAGLKKEQINWEYSEFYYVRNKLKKYGRELVVPLSAEAHGILKYYYNLSESKHRTIFPIFSDKVLDWNDSERIWTRYEYRLKKLNQAMRMMCQMSQLDEIISAYDIRRIWGEHGKEENVEGSIIKDAYGHTKMEITDKYTRVHTVEIIADTNNRLVQGKYLIDPVAGRKKTGTESAVKISGTKVNEPLAKERVIDVIQETSSSKISDRIVLQDNISITLGKEKIKKSVDQFIISSLPFVLKDGKVNRSKLIIKFITETNVSSSELIAEYVDTFFS